MKIEIVEEQFDPWQQVVDYKRDKLLNDPRIGASSVFLGTMRDYNEGEEIESMFLEHYPDMTEKYLTEIVNVAIKKHKINIFLDLKIHDIPQTVKKTIDTLSSLKPDILNVHALGGKKMMEYACLLYTSPSPRD